MTNSNLHAAKQAKQDEFYTMYDDIAREMMAYWSHSPDVFRGAVVMCPADDPEWSNFARFFADVFTEWGLKRLICTSYAQQPETRGRLFVLEREDLDGDGKFDRAALKWSYLDGDGDFRSDEVTALRDEADFVITNPPFSLFREFVKWCVDGDVKFSTVGTINAVNYRVVFPLIRDERIWLGASDSNKGMRFRVPDTARADYSEKVYDPESKTVSFNNVCWYTNIAHGRRREWLDLDTMDNNRTKPKARAVIREHGYPKYDNFDAIEVAYVAAIPSDYDGIMGVPISFLDKYNPDQFEILGITKTWDDPSNLLRTRWYTADECRAAYLHRFGKPGVYDLNTSGVVEGVQKYARILIRHRR